MTENLKFHSTNQPINLKFFMSRLEDKIRSHYGHLLPLVTDHDLIFRSRHLIHQYCGRGAVAFPSRHRYALLSRGLVTWRAMGARNILDDNVRKGTQYVDERCLAENGS